jgi:hypothetical protein
MTAARNREGTKKTYECQLNPPALISIEVYVIRVAALPPQLLRVLLVHVHGGPNEEIGLHFEPTVERLEQPRVPAE